ncbi:MAG: hypothetical protein V7640_2849 [Betaproteobacteria bacterium]
MAQIRVLHKSNKTIDLTCRCALHQMLANYSAKAAETRRDLLCSRPLMRLRTSVIARSSRRCGDAGWTCELGAAGKRLINSLFDVSRFMSHVVPRNNGGESQHREALSGRGCWSISVSALHAVVMKTLSMRLTPQCLCGLAVVPSNCIRVRCHNWHSPCVFCARHARCLTSVAMEVAHGNLKYKT